MAYGTGGWPARLLPGAPWTLLATIALWFAAVLAVPVSAQSDGQLLNYRDADIRAVVDDVARLTGRTFIIDPRVSGNITVISRDQIPADQVFDLFLSTLRVYGYTAVSTINGAYKIVPEEVAILDRTAPPGADGDRLVTEIFWLRTLDPIIALNTLKPLVHRLGRVIAQQNQRYIIVVDYASNLVRLRELLADLDRDTSVTRILPLENTSALDMAETIAQLRGQGQRQESGSLGINVVPVAGSNMLLIKGEKARVEETIALIASVDQQNTDKGSIQVLYLKHADAEKMVPMLEQVSNSLSSGGDSGQGPSGNKATSVSFHQATNALVISATPEMQKTLENVVRKLDIPRARILVEAIIVDVSDRAAKELGLQYVFTDATGSTIPFTAASYSNSASSILAATGAALLAGDNGVDDDGLNSLRRSAFDSLFGYRGITGGVATRSSNGNVFGVILNALDQDVGSNILSTPSVMTLDNEPARLIVGQEIPITTGEALGTDNANPFRTIEREDVGIKLEVRPQINVGENIRLYIKQEVSAIIGPVGPNSSELVTSKREIETTVMAEDGEIIVLGGLIEQDDQKTVDKVPLLGDIPVLGRAFRSEGTSRTKTNLMVFLRPMIIKSADQMNDVTARKYNLMRGPGYVGGDGQQAPLDQLLRDVLGVDAPRANGGATGKNEQH